LFVGARVSGLKTTGREIYAKGAKEVKRKNGMRALGARAANAVLSILSSGIFFASFA